MLYRRDKPGQAKSRACAANSICCCSEYHLGAFGHGEEPPVQVPLPV